MGLYNKSPFQQNNAFKNYILIHKQLPNSSANAKLKWVLIQFNVIEITSTLMASNAVKASSIVRAKSLIFGLCIKYIPMGIFQFSLCDTT